MREYITLKTIHLKKKSKPRKLLYFVTKMFEMLEASENHLTPPLLFAKTSFYYYRTIFNNRLITFMVEKK